MNSRTGCRMGAAALLIIVGVMISIGSGSFVLAAAEERVTFLPAGCNPILTPGLPESWDVGVVFLPKVLSYQGVLFVFYTGTAGTAPEMGPPAIGVAVTTDGLTFRKVDRNPLLEGDGDGFDAYAVREGVPFIGGDGLVLLYNARATEGHGPGRSIGRANGNRGHRPLEPR